MKLKELKYMPIKGDEWEKFERYEDSENGRIGKYVIKRASGLKPRGDEFNLSFKDEDYLEDAKKTNKSAKELAVKDALFHAKFYQSLVDEGIYHPDTQFCVCADNDGNPTMLAVMPFMDTSNRNYLDKKFGNTIKENKKLLKKKYGIRPFFDFSRSWNYGRGSDGEYYWFDLHLFKGFYNHIRIPKKLRKKLESLQYEKGDEI